jgi:hypothetical protein
MARRGLYDQLGGGFHRYCVDGHWGVPHFEKMLYDQGQLLRVYAETWRRGGASDADLAWPIRETARYLAREMRAPEGGFFASQDADSEGEEGKFYVWTPDEVRGVLGQGRGDAFCAAYAVTPEGNFEHATTVLWDVARRPRAELAAERELLRGARAQRVPPGTDEKRVASWNGLAIRPEAREALGDDGLSPRPPRRPTSCRSSATARAGCSASTPRGGRSGRSSTTSRRARRALDHRAGAGGRYLAESLRSPTRSLSASRRRRADLLTPIDVSRSPSARARTTTARRRARRVGRRSACCASRRSRAARISPGSSTACSAPTPSSSTAPPNRSRPSRVRRSSPEAASPSP